MTNYSEKISDGYLYITVADPKTDWREWLKTIGEPEFPYEVNVLEDKSVVAKVSAVYDKTPAMKTFKSIFHKTAACVGCGVCESNCRQGAISFKDGLHIEKKNAFTAWSAMRSVRAVSFLIPAGCLSKEPTL